MDKNALIVLVLTIGIIAAVNFVMFGIVRGLTRGDHRWIRALGETLRKPNESSNRPYNELRQRMQDLSENQKRDEQAPH